MNESNFMRNGTIILLLLIMVFFFFKSLTKMYIFQLIKCENKDVIESIDSDDRNSSSISLNKSPHQNKIQDGRGGRGGGRAKSTLSLTSFSSVTSASVRIGP